MQENWGREARSWFTDQSELDNGCLFFDLRSPFFYTWSGVACIKPMGAFLNAILWGLMLSELIWEHLADLCILLSEKRIICMNRELLERHPYY